MTSDLLERVCARTMEWPFRMWGFGEAIALRGLLAASSKVSNPEAYGFVQALLGAYIARGVGKSFEEHVAPGREMLMVFQQSGDQRLLAAAKTLADLHLGRPCNSNGVRFCRPDLPGWRKQIWVDCMDSEPPFLSLLARITGDQDCADRAAEQLLAYSRLLQDDRTGLFFHGHEESCGRNGQIWARGNGWALMGLTDTLLELPQNHRHRSLLSDSLLRLVGGLKQHQDLDGLWHTLIPDNGSYLESTLAAMTATALPRAFAGRLLHEKEFGEMASRARAAVLKATASDGRLELVTDATPVAERAMYCSRAFGTFPWGQGVLLLMLSEL